ncbi:hypothetical protein [Clostridium ljungdahlii]|uniref:Uncharacterized protein n=1 Tax=Clostridium ljungdahlii TaxID=1538 RepID=A0A162LB81_9CLOT|nr:hypothetical protein [Clostridium ljungdahlii]OAA91276.1 hypothetical protein WY13_00841 [Clostridium ljungdahlii]
MIHFRIKDVFDEIKQALQAKGANNVTFEDGDNKYEKVLCLGAVRVGKVKISYPDDTDRDDCCNVVVSFDYYLVNDVTGGVNKFDFFIDNFIKITNAR